MHIPDGFLDAKTTAVTFGLSAAGLGWATRTARRTLPPRRIPLIGVTAAFGFAAQMINCPVAGGTSGHLIGGVLAAALLGPSGAVLVIASVLIVQCLLFMDGGLLALGANIFNMGIVGSAGAYGIYALVRRCIPGQRGLFTAAAFAAWLSVALAATCCAAQLALSGTAPWKTVFPAMASMHMLIGIGEALITTLVLAAIASARPELLQRGIPPDTVRPRADLLVYGLLIAIGLAVLVAPFASPWPDGLSRVASRLGFAHHATPAILPAPMRDYAVPGISTPVMATAVAGCVGTLLMFLVAFAFATLLVRRKQTAHTTMTDT